MEGSSGHHMLPGIGVLMLDSGLASLVRHQDYWQWETTVETVRGKSCKSLLASRVNCDVWYGGAEVARRQETEQCSVA